MIGVSARSAWVPSLSVTLWLAAVGLGGAGAVALHRFGPPHTSPPLPELHGQATWPAGSRPAPAFDLRDQTGKVVSLAGLRGHSVLVAFLGPGCSSGCTEEARELDWIMSGLPVAERPSLLVFTAGSSGGTAAAIRQLKGAWPWHWIGGTKAELARSERSFGSTGGSTLLLIDRRGYERTAYLYPFQPPSVQGDLAALAGEAG